MHVTRKNACDRGIGRTPFAFENIPYLCTVRMHVTRKKAYDRGIGRTLFAFENIPYLHDSPPRIYRICMFRTPSKSVMGIPDFTGMKFLRFYR